MTPVSHGHMYADSTQQRRASAQPPPPPPPLLADFNAHPSCFALASSAHPFPLPLQSRSASPSRTGSRSPTKSITPSVTASSTVSPTRTPSATATVTSANTQIADATVQFAVAIAGLAAPTAAPSANPGSLVVTSLASDATAGYALRASTYCELAQSGTPVAMSSILVTSATSSTGTVYFGPTDTVNSLNTVPVCPSPEPVPVSRRLSAAVEAAAAPVLAASASRGGVGARSLQSVPSTSVVIGMALSLVSPVNPATATSASALYQLATFYTSSAALGNVVAAAVANGDAASVVDALLLYLAAQAQLGVGAASASSPVNAFGANPAPAVLINSAVLVNTEAAAAAQQEDADAERIYRRNAVIGGCAGVAGFIIVVVLIYEFAVRRPRVAQAVADAKAHEAEMDKARAQAVADAAAGKPGPKAATLRPTGANGADVAAALSDLTIAVAGEASAAAVAGKAKAGLGQPQEVVVADLGAFGVLITDGKAAPIAGSLAATTLPVNETQVQLTSLSIAVNAEGSAAAAKRAYADGSGYATLVAAEAAAAQAAKTRGPSAAEPVAINASTPASVQKAAADLAAYGVV